MPITPDELRAAIRDYRYLARHARLMGLQAARRYHVTKALDARARLRAL